MAQLSDKGAPTRNTKGALGDIYTDLLTGSTYMCVFSYRDNNDKEFDCQWKKIGEGNKKPVVPAVPEPAVETEPVPEEGPTESHPTKKYNKKNRRTNYTAYSKK